MHRIDREEVVVEKTEKGVVAKGEQEYGKKERREGTEELESETGQG